MGNGKTLGIDNPRVQVLSEYLSFKGYGYENGWVLCLPCETAEEEGPHATDPYIRYFFDMELGPCVMKVLPVADILCPTEQEKKRCPSQQEKTNP